MRYALAIGYPLRMAAEGGRPPEEEIELRDRRLRLNARQAALWSRLFRLEELPWADRPLAEELGKLGAAAVSDSAGGLLEALASCRPVRQGFCLPDESGTAAVWLGETAFPLTALQEQMWLAADGAAALGEILDHAASGWRNAGETRQKALLEQLLQLTAAELCYFR